MPLQAGARLGPYEILGILGAGGMGEVYRARDTRLGRVIAVKVLPAWAARHAERRVRFEREARAASALNHPNIVTIHDVGQEGEAAYLVMECVEGRTLRALIDSGPVPGPTLLDVAIQVAEGLAKAHAAGIAHRDLKPENVMITRDGAVKILDFGLAKLMEAETAPAARTSTETTSAIATRPGAVVGTASYMSPEQAAGQAVDFRTDQFALGLMLYEMAAGRHPLRRATNVETLAAIVREEPQPLQTVSPGTPPGLCRVVERCLAKSREDRYASTRDLARDLRDLREDLASASDVMSAAAVRRRTAVRWPAVAVAVVALLAVAGLAVRRAPSPPQAPAPPDAGGASIAVLPFQNLGGAAEEEYYVDGMTDAVITDLARVPGLLVIARNTVFRYKGQATDVRQIGRELGVRYLLEGSTQRAGATLRVNVQLVDAGSGYHVWADRYDRPASDVFAVQDEIARHVVDALHLRLGGASDEARPSPPTANLEAYDAYLRGLFHAAQYEWAEKDKGIPWLEKAIALDPGFAAAHAALAQQYARKSFERDPRREWEAKAFVAAEKALSLDPKSAVAYAVRGNLVWTLANHFQHEKAVRDLKHALTLNPNLASAHVSLGSVYTHVGLLDRAAEQLQAAQRLEPGGLESLVRIARVHLYGQDYEAALKVLRSRPEIARSWQAALALDYLGRRDEARAVLDQLARSADGANREFNEDVASVRAMLAARRGDAAEVESLVEHAVRVGSGSSHFHHATYNIASAYAILGRRAQALQWLRRTAAEGMPCYTLFAGDPNLDALRGDPAFESFMSETKRQWEGFSATL